MDLAGWCNGLSWQKVIKIENFWYDLVKGYLVENWYSMDMSEKTIVPLLIGLQLKPDKFSNLELIKWLYYDTKQALFISINECGKFV